MKKTELKQTTRLQAKRSLAKKPVKRGKTKVNKKAWDIARAIWRLHGSCEYCGKRLGEVQLQGAHIIGVGSAPRIGADLRNGFSLCSYHHRHFSSYPHEFVEWVDTTWAKEYMPELRRLSKEADKPDWEQVIARLKGVKQDIEAGSLTIEEARQQECG